MNLNNCFRSKMKNLVNKISFRNLISVILPLMCYGCFLFFSTNSIFEFRDRKIGVNQFSFPVTELESPTITVCSKDVFKNADNDIEPEDILKNLSNYIFTWDDVFHHTFQEDSKDWNSHNIFSKVLGICFSLKSNQNLNSTSNRISFRLLKGKRYQIYLHEAHVEYWFQYLLHPGEEPFIKELDTTESNDLAYTFGTLKYTVSCTLNTKSYHCDPNATMESFTRCAFDSLENLNCYPSVIKIGSNINESKICTNHTELLRKTLFTYEHLQNTLRNNGSYNNCIKPCCETSYDASFRDMPKNSMLMDKNKKLEYVLVILSYNDLVVLTKKQYFIISLESLTSDIGGFLGLFLGFSCLSIISWTSKQAKRCI